MNEGSGAQKYLEELQSRAVMPRGFRFGTTSLEFFPAERPVEKPLGMNLGIILADEPVKDFSLRLTRNAVAGAPIHLARERRHQESIQGILINNKISNVGAPHGLQTAQRLCAAASREFGLDANALLAASTGIIGWSLPEEAMVQALPRLRESLGKSGPLDMARAIMTTDRWPKLRSRTLGQGSILAMAKGAGMIEPNLATMLVFIVTDIKLPREALDRALGRAVEVSFNAISVDSDQSTSDMCVLLSSGKVEGVDEEAFSQALMDLCRELAVDIVRNGEGTKHVIKVTVEGFGDQGASLGKAVVNSPLVKTAIYGNDPNVGRILASLGDWAGNNGVDLDLASLSVRLWDVGIYSEGCFHLDQTKETLLSHKLKEAAQDPKHHGWPEHQRTVDITVLCAKGTGRATVWGSDLGYEYIEENADYRS